MANHRKTVEYDENVAERICTLLGSGVPLVEVTKKPKMPTASVIYGWRLRNRAFKARYDAAQDAGIRIRMEVYEGLAVAALKGKIEKDGVAVTDLRERDMLSRNYARLAGITAAALVQRSKVEHTVDDKRTLTDDQIRARYKRVFGKEAPILPKLEGRA